MREIEAEARRHSFGQVEFERALQSLLDRWAEYALLDPADPNLSDDERMAAGDCARLVAELDGLGRMPGGWSRRDALTRARAFLSGDFPGYPREERARLEADCIEETANAGDLEAALALAGAARVPFADVPHVLAEIRSLEANCLQVLGRYAEALDSALAARHLLEGLAADQVPEAYVPTMVKAVEGLILIALGLPDRAVPLLAECRAELERPDNQDSEGLVTTLATQLALARDDFDWVEKNLPPRLESGGFRGDTPSGTDARWLDVAVAGARKALIAGAGLEEARTELRDRLGDGPLLLVSGMDGFLALAELELELGNHEKSLELITRLEGDLAARLSPSAALPRQAITELKGRIHLRTGSSRGLQAVHAELESSFEHLLDAWDSAPQRDGGVGFLLFDSRSSLVVTLIRVTVATQPGFAGLERALGYVLAAESRSTLARQLGAEGSTVEQIQAELAPSNGGMLAYIPSPHGSVLFAITRDDIRVFDVGRIRDLRTLNAQWCASWTEQAAGSGSDSQTPQAVDLLDGLLPQGLEGDLARWTSLTIVGIEALDFVPFEALQPRRSGAPMLGLSHSIAYLPSLSVGLELARRAASEESVAGEAPVLVTVGLGEIDAGDGSALPGLPWQARDLDTLRGHWSESAVDLETSPLPARRAVLEAGERGVLLLEVFSHGVRDVDRERAQGFAFDRDSTIYPDDLRGRATPALVALAVCDAGRGLLRGGDEGISHFGGALLASGTRTVLLSRHDLSFEATIALLAAFNRNLAEGKPLADALLAARREIAGETKWSHPRFHALLHLYGNGGGIAPAPLLRADRERSGSRSQRILLVALTASLVLVGLRWLRARRA